MKKHYGIVYVTNLPAFYKINLWNEIARHKSLLVIFTGSDDNYVRNDDFVKGERRFDCLTLPDGGLKGIGSLRRELRGITYDEMVVAGNNTAVYWWCALTNRRSHLKGVSESSAYESTTAGLKGAIKQFYASRFCRYYVSGKAHERFMRELGYKGEVIVTHGVGIFNFVEQPPFRPCSAKCNRLLFVGRLSPEKNISRLIEAVRRHPEWQLTIAGFGPLEAELKEMAGTNIKFIGAVNNKDLPAIYRAHDAFVLASTSEVWGLVVEEALNNGLPVALSERVGCRDDWANNGLYGLTFDPFSIEGIEAGLSAILNPEINNAMRRKIAMLDFGEIERRQAECYL